MAKKRGKRVQRLIEKYGESKKPNIFDNKSKLGRSYRKVVSSNAQIRKIKRQLAVETDPLKAGILRDKLFKGTVDLNITKVDFYEVKALSVIAERGMEMYPGEDMVTPEERKVMDNIIDLLTNYKHGDETMDKFYHEYGFDTINDQTVYAYCKAEGLI